MHSHYKLTPGLDRAGNSSLPTGVQEAERAFMPSRLGRGEGEAVL